jgi:hypothetical protein
MLERRRRRARYRVLLLRQKGADAAWRSEVAALRPGDAEAAHAFYVGACEVRRVHAILLLAPLSATTC